MRREHHDVTGLDPVQRRGDDGAEIGELAGRLGGDRHGREDVHLPAGAVVLRRGLPGSAGGMQRPAAPGTAGHQQCPGSGRGRPFVDRRAGGSR